MTWVMWLVGIAACAAVVIVVTHVAEGEEFVRLLREARPWWLALAVALQAATYLAQGAVWSLLAAAAGGRLPWREAAGLSLAVLFVNQALPTSGASGVALTRAGLARTGLPLPKTAAVILIDVGMRYAAYGLCLSVALGLGLADGRVPSWVLGSAAVFVVAALAVAVFMIALPTPHLDWLERLVFRFQRPARLVGWLAAAEGSLCGRKALLAQAGVLHLSIFCLDAATMGCAAAALGAEAAPQSIFIAFMISTLLRTLGIMPGGLGTFEAASVWLLRLLSLPWAAALSTTLLFRGLTLWIPMLPGFHFSRRVALSLRQAGGHADPSAQTAGS